MTELTISEARKALLDLAEKLARTPERAITITRRGRPVLAILP
jgi:PHD/YefM family antitoxin component YafN of YafNO toxin-antitoxin module